jgi:dihydrofolate reductase
VHRFVNELLRPVGTYLYGRRMYETMVYWETGGDEDEITRDFAQIWRGADKVVFSRTLGEASSERTRIERDFNADAVRRLKEAATGDVAVGGAELAGQAIAAGLVDELQLFVVPVLVGAGVRALPDHVFAPLALLEERRFDAGTVFLRYRFDR